MTNLPNCSLKEKYFPHIFQSCKETTMTLTHNLFFITFVTTYLIGIAQGSVQSYGNQEELRSGTSK